MAVIRFDRGFNLTQIQAAKVRHWQWLWLNAAQRCSAAAFVFVGMCLLPHNVFIAAAAMGKQGHQIGLGAGWHKQAGCHARPVGQRSFQLLHGRVFAPDIITHFSSEHGLPHGSSGFGHRVAAQIYPGVGIGIRHGILVYIESGSV